MPRSKALETYQNKRDFSITPEPAPKIAKTKARKQALRFVIQKHAARRLHYDFRLEYEGVFKSWAVTRGPSLVPGDKRLAVHVEDHPLDYGTFEGTIPQGQYGAGTVLLWDRGIWSPEGDVQKGLSKGHLDFSLEGEKLHGRWHLVKLRARSSDAKDNWLLIKSDDEFARSAGDPDILDEAETSVLSGRAIEEIGAAEDRQWTSGQQASPAPASKGTGPRARLRAASLNRPSAPKEAKKSAAAPAKITLPAHLKKRAALTWREPQLATLSDKPPDDGSYVHEIKFDGYRMQAIVSKGHATLWTRRGLDWTQRFSRIAQALDELNRDGLHLDGEIVVEDARGITDFARLQAAIKNGDQSQLVFYLFDLFAFEGKDVTGEVLTKRKELLEKVISPTDPDGPLRYSTHFKKNAGAMLDHVCQSGAEGIVSKRADRPVSQGRNLDWLKTKCVNRQEFLILGFVPSTTSQKLVGSLLLGLYEQGKLIYAGRVGSGFSNKLAQDLYRALIKTKHSKPPLSQTLSKSEMRNVVWVEPLQVAEVAFRGWTGSGILRQASFKGLREDKDPRDITREIALTKTDQETETGATPHLTHPDRMLWPDLGITKEGLADYYSAAWKWMEPHVTQRPLALVRCPLGIGQSCFFQKHEWKGMGAQILHVTDPTDAEPLVGIDSLDGLLALAQASTLEIHPWGAKLHDIDHPDRLTFDLDPGEGVSWASMIEAAQEVKQRLAKLKLDSFVKTTGGKGLHVMAPIKPTVSWPEAKDFCHSIAKAMAADSPQRFLATMTKAQRTGRIYVDYLRNGRGATSVCAYSPRARPEAGVSTPLAWKELSVSLSAAQFSLTNIESRLQHLRKDPWSGFADLSQRLPVSGSRR